MSWLAIQGAKKTNFRSLFSLLPLVSEAHNTHEMQVAVREELRREWDAIVLDHYGSSWMLKSALRYAKEATRNVVIAHVSHNFEQNLALSLFMANRTKFARAIVLLQNFIKIRYWEGRLARSVNVCTAITSEDVLNFQRIAPSTKFITLTPGYSGNPSVPRTIAASTSRKVILIGSFRWGVKELNLRRLIAAAEECFNRANISLEIIGALPDGLIKEFSSRLKSCHFHGFVEDFRPFLTDARIALVPEVVGGGFKLKFLDYIFGRMPVATISAASAGLPEDIRNTFIQAKDMDDLVRKVTESIDDFDLLNRMQTEAYTAAESKYAWLDRGILFRDILFPSAGAASE